MTERSKDWTWKKIHGKEVGREAAEERSREWREQEQGRAMSGM